MVQRTFNFESAHRLARKSDPSTSKAAAAVITLTIAERRQHALNAVMEYPGRTARELDKINESGDREIGKRLRELVDRGLVEEGEKRSCDVTGRLALTWYPSKGA